MIYSSTGEKECRDEEKEAGDGFHLTGMPKAKTDATARALKALTPALVVATHCTGFAAQSEFARWMPDSFALNTAVTRRYRDYRDEGTT